MLFLVRCAFLVAAFQLFFSVHAVIADGQGWCDDFEAYPAGSHPPTWYGTGNSSATRVDNMIAYEGNNSLRFFGLIGSCWAGLASRPINVSCPFMVELAIRNGTENLYGCHPERGSFEFKMGPNWWDPGVPGGFLFKESGDFKISIQGNPLFSGFALNEWHNVRAYYDTPGDGHLHAKYWVDGQYLGEYTQTIGPEGFNPQYIMIGSQEGTAWFDDLCVRSILPVAFDIKPGSCPNPLNVMVPGMDWIPWGDEDEETVTDATQTTAAKPRPDGPKKWKAVLPAAILGTDDFDVTMIDPATIRIFDTVAPVRWNYADVGTPVGPDADECECTDEGSDGYTDLTVKFDRGEVIAALGAVSDGDIIAVTVTGQLTDGTPFEGADCILIIANGEGLLASSDTDESDLELSNHPNPFNPTTTISFRLDQPSYVRLDVFNVAGQKVRTLVDDELATGEHSVVWEGDDSHGRPVSSGIYFYRLQAGDFRETKQMILLK